MKLKTKEKEQEKLTKVISDLKLTINSSQLNNQEELLNYKKYYRKIKIRKYQFTKAYGFK